jgi:2-oxo-4-hydroxy-4-carboxy-5-ureidoimidazoline decarboxylase
MAASRPFADAAAMLEAAERGFRELGHEDWREAFASHPQIGDLDSLRARFASTAAFSVREQSGVVDASETTLAALARGNQAYREKFGYIFIVCASGKTADEMLGLLQKRLENGPDQEIVIAAAEQAAITRIRLRGLGG